MIQHLWKRQTDYILDIHIRDTDAKSYISCSVESVLAVQGKEKKLSISKLAWNNDTTSHRLWHLLMACWAMKHQWYSSKFLGN
eukprot:7430535-Ditylum_brightwellii.AAC.1